MATRDMRNKGYSEEEISYATAFNYVDDEKLNAARDEYRKLYEEHKKVTDAEKEEVKALGGLHIIGTERHESRRIDNQLRGRSGRQGDPGSSVFFLSFEDDLFRRFSTDKMRKVFAFFKFDENTPIQIKMLAKQIERAQEKIELQNFGIRKTVLQFDDVMNKQREIIYAERNAVLSESRKSSQPVFWCAADRLGCGIVRRKESSQFCAYESPHSGGRNMAQS